MAQKDFEKIGTFKVHKSILSSLNGWKPHYWSSLTYETRLRLEKEKHDRFLKKLCSITQEDLEYRNEDYANYIIVRAASHTLGAFWSSCLHEYQKRVDEINEGTAVRCGAKRKNGQQCRANAIHGTGRCRHHGGKSTGPITIYGKIKSLSKLAQYRKNPALLDIRRQELIDEMENETGLKISAESDQV